MGKGFLRLLRPSDLTHFPPGIVMWYRAVFVWFLKLRRAGDTAKSQSYRQNFRAPTGSATGPFLG